MPRKRVVRKERGVFEKVPGSDIWWIRYKVDSMTVRYAHLAPEHNQAAIEKLDSAIV